MHKFALVKLCVMKIHRIIPHAVVDLVCRCTLSFLRLMMIFLHAFCNIADSNPINISHAQQTSANLTSYLQNFAFMSPKVLLLHKISTYSCHSKLLHPRYDVLISRNTDLQYDQTFKMSLF